MILIFLKRHCKTNEEHCDQSAAELPFLSFVTHVITNRRRKYNPGDTLPRHAWGKQSHPLFQINFPQFTLRELMHRACARKKKVEKKLVQTRGKCKKQDSKTIQFSTHKQNNKLFKRVRRTFFSQPLTVRIIVHIKHAVLLWM